MTRTAPARPVSARPGDSRLSRLRLARTGRSRPGTTLTRTGPTVVAAGVLAGLALTGGVATAIAAEAGSGPEWSRPVAARPAAPSPLAQRPVAPTRPTAERASRGGARTALTPVHYVQRTVPVGPAFSGEASWYGGMFQGRQTASGERFDTEQLTAASKTLPFGTRLQVCRTGRCVVVRVNDRGPYVGSRILDLSHAAARALGYDGVVHITAVPVATRTVAVPVAAAAQPGPVPAAAAAQRGAVPAVAHADAAAPARRIVAARMGAPFAAHPVGTPGPTSPVAGSRLDLRAASSGPLPAALLVGGIGIAGALVSGRVLGTWRRRSHSQS